MSWAKLDDRFHAHPKVIRAWQDCPASVGLHAMALSYSASYELDGAVPRSYAEQALGASDAPWDAVEALVDAELWIPDGEAGWTIKDFTEYNPSRAELARRRDARKRAGRKGGKASGESRREP